ncbi:MAG: hypothetical protein H6536_01340 [Bacteroidales bacterium]|nr:hypothetical protein [Bacteroidales bacterium]
MKTKNSIAYKKLAFEFISVSFAVFLALMLNQWKDNYNNQKLVKQTLTNINIEVKQNSERVKEMLDSHKLLLTKIESILAHIERGKIPNETLGELSFSLISTTAWETAKLTQAIAHMDINLVSEIAGIYEYQEYYRSIVKQYSLSNEMNKLFESEKEILENKKFFIDLQNFLKNKIICSETDLLEYYNEIQKTISEIN